VSTEVPMRRLLQPPSFESEEMTQRARIFHRVVWIMMGTTSAFLLTVIAFQTELVLRGLVAMGVVNTLGLTLLRINSLGRTHKASVGLVVGLIALVTFMALQAGGIRSPGVTFYFVFVLMAGVLLGLRAGIITAVACAALALGLVVLETTGYLPVQTVSYAPGSLWLLNCMYLGVVLILLQLATGAMKGALDRVETELSERREAERRLEMALDAGVIGTWDYDVASRTFTGDLRSFTLLGVDAAQGWIPVDDWASLIDADDASRVGEALRRLVSGEAARGRVEYRVNRPDGSRRDLDVAARTVADERAAVVRLTGTIIDATDRKAAEREREHLLYNLTERVKELGLLHAATRLVQFDRPFDRSVLEELVQLMPGAWLHYDCCEARITFADLDVRTAGWPDDSAWRQSAPFTTSGGAGVVEVVYTAERRPEVEGPFLAEERDLIDSVAEILAAFIQRHYTELRRRALEQQLRQSQKMEALGTLAGGIAHDFNNILTAIGGNVQLAIEDLPPTHSASAPLGEVARAHTRAVDLVRRILTFSRKQDSHKAPVCLEAVVDEAVQLLRVSLPKTTAVHTGYASGLPIVLADTTQIHQVVMNLGTNASYAMKESGGTLSFDLDVVSFPEETAVPSVDLTTGDYVRLSVTDTGIGMPPQVVDRLFEPFFTTKGDAGTGLGLSVVHGIVREHGGTITVDSTPGQGTTFAVYLPVPQPGALVPGVPA
jgi:signal transduction histidine kinase